jgi:hypothetical protein
MRIKQWGIKKAAEAAFIFRFGNRLDPGACAHTEVGASLVHPIFVAGCSWMGLRLLAGFSMIVVTESRQFGPYLPWEFECEENCS